MTVFEKVEPGVSINARAGSKYFPLYNSSRVAGKRWQQATIS